MKVYRNIYFLKNMISQGKGDQTVYYYGTMYSDAKNIKNFDKLYA